MELNKVLKGLAVALPMMTLAACSANNEQTFENQDGMNPQPEFPAGETGAVEPVDMTEEEQLVAKYGAGILETTINFAYDQSDIAPEFRKVLNAHAQYLVASRKFVTVQGHTDERGTPEYNIALGERRAKAVVRYLQSMGVPADQLNTVSYGEEKPLTMEHSEAAYAENRRAVLVY